MTTIDSGPSGQMESLIGDLNAIRIDPPRPTSLRIDTMFSRAAEWKSSSTPSVAGPSVQRAPSPARRRVPFPQPKPLDSSQVVSPLGQLFDYSELLPYVLRDFERPSELAVLARVNRAFNEIATKQLYEHVWMRPWEPGAHEKLIRLFEILYDRPDLCKLIKQLDVRYFPLATRDTERYDLDERLQLAVEKMANLEHLIWTRDRSLRPALVQNLCSLQNLKVLEITGHSYRYYDPTVLGCMPALEDLRVTMPDSLFRDSLVRVVEALDQRDYGGLRSFAVIARSSPLLDDEMLKKMAIPLRRLTRLTLWGCTRITRAGVFEILHEAQGMEEMSLDALAHSELQDLSRCPALPRLHTLSLSFPPHHKTSHHPHLTSADLPRFPRETPNLTSLFLTLSGDRIFIPRDGIEHLTSQLDFARLKRLSILNLFIGISTLTALVTQAKSLEELYISVNNRTTVLECGVLNGCGLKILHVNAPERWGPTPDDFVELAKIMPMLEQVGTGNRVYEVIRRYDGDEHVVEVCRWSKTQTPGYFQVWRG